MDGWSLRRQVGLVVLAVWGGLAAPVDGQGAAQRPPDLLVTRLAGGGSDSVIAAQAPAQPSGGLSSLPVTQLDDRARGADLDGARRITLSLAKPLPLADMLWLLVSGTPFSIVTDDAVSGTFSGQLRDLTLRQALEAVLFPRSLDYDVQGSLIRVFPRRATTRLFDVNYLNVRRTWQRGLRSAIAVAGSEPAAAELSEFSESDLFDELGKGVQSLLSETGRMHVDRTAGLVQVTDFADRLEQVGVYVEAVQLRATRQVRIDARVLEVTLSRAGAAAIDWKAVASRSGATRPATMNGQPARSAGMRGTDIEALKNALAEQGSVRMIAAPQVVAMNNEPAVMRVGTQGVYFTSASAVDAQGRTERTSRPTAMLEGLTLTVTPQIAADGIVQLNVAPTYAERAGVSKAARGDAFPVLQVSEADTLVRVQDGDTVVISGFLRDRQNAKPNGGIAGFFGAQTHETARSELVIMLTATVVSAGGSAVALAR